MDGIRKYQITTCLILALLTLEIGGKIRPSTKTSLGTIKTTLTDTGKNVQARVDKLSDYLDSEEGGSEMEAVSSSLETIGGAVSSLTSGDTVEIISGTLDVISAATSLIPVGGPIISTVFSLIGTIFGAIAGGGGDDVGTVVRKEIEMALNNYADSELKAEGWGTFRVYANSHAYLARKEDGAPLNKHELASLTGNVPVYQGIDFLGKLVYKVEENAKSSDPVQVMRAMEYVQLYVTLAVLRSSILWEMYALVRTVPDSSFTADAIARHVKIEEEHDETFLKFLLKPDYSQAVFFAYFNTSEWNQTMTFMGKKGLKYQRLDHLTHGEHYLRPQKWTNWYMYMTNDAWGTMAGTTSNSSQSLFYFDPISLEDNLFYLRSCKWSSWYVYMKSDAWGHCRGSNGKPGPQGEWKVIMFNDGRYMLSPLKWPKWFIYMKSDSRGYIRGWNGDPGIQGHWLIN